MESKPIQTSLSLWTKTPIKVANRMRGRSPVVNAVNLMTERKFVSEARGKYTTTVKHFGMIIYIELVLGIGFPNG